MSRRRFTAEQDRQVAAQYLDGKSSTLLAREYRCDKEAVLNAIRRQGVAVRRSGKAKRLELDARRDEIIALYRSGESVWAIKRAMKCPHGNPIQRILRSAGITIEKRLTAGEKHHAWKGGHHLSQDGYRRIRIPRSDPFHSMCSPNGYVMEHRVVMARALGRVLRSTESVHHVDGNRENNALSNLQLRHGKHGTGIQLVCLDCGSHNINAVSLK